MSGIRYPAPFGFHARNHPGHIIEGYGIYKLLEGTDGDIEPVTNDIAGTGYTFSQALAICEAHNGKAML